jgi:putative ABC transport system permease protein
VGSGGDATPWHTIIGVVGSVRHLGLDQAPRREIYYPAGGADGRFFDVSEVLVMRTAGDPARAAGSVRAAITALDARVAVGSVEPMATLVARSLAPRRFAMILVGVFAGLALLLAAIGLYGVMAYTVAQRTQEIGVRMALGADARDVVAMVVKQGMALFLGGAVLGLAAALALGRVLASLLFEVSASDPITLAAVIALLGLVALVASYLPAHRATRLHPMIALRRG